MLIDSHAHLDLIKPKGQVRAVIDRALSAGVGRIITIGIDVVSSQWAVDCANAHPEVFATIGVHPHDSKGIDDGTYDQLKSLAGESKVLALGEIGLDFYRMHSPKGVQLTRFYEQIDLARDLNLPLIIHSRQAMTETIQALNDTRAHEMGGIIHCYSGDLDTALKFAEQGWLISIPGTVTFPKAGKLQQVAAGLPLASLVVETDAPFLTPIPHRGKQNEPAYVAFGAAKVAELQGVNIGELARACAENLNRVLGMPLYDPLKTDAT